MRELIKILLFTSCLALFLIIGLFGIKMHKKSFKLHDSENTLIRYHTKINIANITYDKNKDSFYFVVSWEHKGDKVVAILMYSNLTLKTIKAIFEKKYRFEANIVYDTETKELVHVYHKMYGTIITRGYPDIVNVKKKIKGSQI